MDENTRISLIKDEYLLLQKFYEDSDQKLLTLKGVSVTISFGLIGTAFYQSEYLWLFASLTSLMFWLLETLWKSFQYLHAYRISKIEQALRDNTIGQIIPFQIYTSWFSAYKESGLNYWKNFFLTSIYLPHLLSLLLGFILFISKKAGVF